MNNAFTTTVASSRALSRVQKKDLLDSADELSQEYRDTVASALRTFDEHSVAREEYLREQLQEQYDMFQERLDQEGIDEVEKKALLTKAKKQMEAFFSTD